MKKEFKKPEIKLVNLEQNVSILAASEPFNIMGFSIDLSPAAGSTTKVKNKVFR